MNRTAPWGQEDTISRKVTAIAIIVAMIMSLLYGYSPRTAAAAAASWQANTTYTINDWVIYNDLEYQCIQAHTSEEGLKPSIAVAYWAKNGKPIPGKLEAENWDSMQGVQNEATTDTGAGLDVGNIEAGDWLEYKVNVASAGIYTVDFRLATKYSDKELQLQDSRGTVLAAVYVPNTTGWQKWTTVSVSANLSAGPQTLRITTNTGNFNINWMMFTDVLSASTPTGVTGKAGDTQAMLNWPAVTGAISYNVKRSETTGGPYELIKNMDSNRYVDSKLMNDKTYYYVVSAVTDSGESPNSMEVGITPILLPDIPAAPTGLTGIARDSQVTLKWESVEGAEQYHLLRRDDGGAKYSVIASDLTATQYNDAGLTDGMVYEYTVQAQNAGGLSENSVSAKISPVTPLAKPAGLIAVPGDARVDITWNPVPGASSYSVKRSVISGRTYSVVASNLTAPEFTDSTVHNGTNYYYVVSALSAQTESMNSDQARVSPVHFQQGVPSSPNEVTAQAGVSKVNLQWTEVAEADSYLVKRAASLAGPFTTIASVTQTNYLDNSITNGLTYYYVVSAVNARGSGADSLIQIATPAKVIVVAKDGTGDYTTVTDALNSIPTGNSTRRVIYIQDGIYHEKVAVPNSKPLVSLVGESRDGTILTYDDYANSGIGTGNSHTLLVSASDFTAENMTIRNTSFERGNVGPAVALNVTGDRAIFTNVYLAGFQDTLYANGGRQYFNRCIIEGDVDWIFGNAAAYFYDSEIKFVGGFGGHMTAASTDEKAEFGYVFMNSRLTRGTSSLKESVTHDPWRPEWDIDTKLAATNGSLDLGRPWRANANVKYINTWMDAHIKAVGWDNWGNPSNESTARYGEYNSSGPGANAKGRYRWSSQLTSDEANQYTVQNVLKGADGWDPTLFGTLPGHEQNEQQPASPTGLSVTFPSGVDATLGDSPVALSWNTVEGASSYRVYRGSEAGGPYLPIASDLIPSSTSPLATIQGEDWTAMYGVKTQNTSDEGGGLNVSYIDPGDWMDYAIQVSAGGFYTLDLRVSAPDSGKQLQLKSGNGSVLSTLDIPQTGDWQSWTTVSVNVNLPAGNQTLRLYSVTGSYNLNWLRLTEGVKDKVQYSDMVVNTGAPFYYVVTAVNANGESVYSTEVSLSSAPVKFDRNHVNQANLSVSVKRSGDTMTGIMLGTHALNKGTDYTANGSIYTLRDVFLSQLPIGKNTLTFTFASGTKILLAIEVVNSTTLPGQTLSNIPTLELYSLEGVAPFLPSIVPVQFTDGSEKALAVVWSSIDPAKYASVGNFTVQGTVTGTDVKATAKVSVKSADSVGFVTGGDDLQTYQKDLPFDMPAITLPTFPNVDFNIEDYGAVGDGITKNTAAFAKAIEAATLAGGGRVVVPAGVWLTGSIQMASNIDLHVEAGALIQFSPDYDDYNLVNAKYQPMLAASGLSNIAITGKGVIDGNGQYWRYVKKGKVTTTQWNYLLSLGGVLTDNGSVWYPSQQAVGVYRPIMVDIYNSSNVLVDGPTFMNSPQFATSFTKIRNLVIRNSTVNNDAWYQNGDGLDVTSSQNVVLYHNTVNAGDDGIGMKASYDPSPTNALSEVVIADNIVFRGHGGLSIGSNTSGGIHNLAVRNNQYIGTDNGINIKSFVGGGGPIENIYIDGLHMQNIGYTALSINDFYTGHSEAVDNAQLGVDNRVPEVKNIHIRNVTVDGASEAVSIDALANVPLRNVELTNVKMSTQTGFVSSNTTDIQFNHVQIVPANGTLYTMNNAADILLNDVLCPPGTSTFIHLKGFASNILLQDTDFSQAGIPFHLDSGISPSVITVSNPGSIQIPKAPANVSATTGRAEILLRWDEVAGADYYAVKRSVNSSEGYVTIASNVTDSTYLDNADLTAGNYYYVITAVNVGGESDNSNEVSAVVNAPSLSLPYATVMGEGTTFAGQQFGLVYGLNNDYVTESVSTAVYGQELTFEYDPDLILYDSVECLADEWGVESVDKDEVNGKITIKLASTGAGILPSGDMLKMLWHSSNLNYAGDTTAYLHLHPVLIADGSETVSKLSNTIYGMKIMIDKTVLASRVDVAKSLTADQYNPSTWLILQTYLTSAKVILAGSQATQNQVNAAASNLQLAMDGLDGASDKSALALKIAIAQATSDYATIGSKWGQYTKTVVNELNNAIGKAMQVVNNPNATKVSVEQAIIDLDAALATFLSSANSASIGDLAILSAHYGISSAHTDWIRYQIYDLNKDGLLDIVDLAALAQLILHP
ncbi:hypothetical protein BSK64_11930 [Paenibacillus odorifer]|uniref:pectinesterase family protein n=1 Tax=Paenibacillus odorifer TaxID=189426 RepID=UPI00096D7C41|nr:pectinesterase family protein [Paenibacillus odorifer]OME06346.1 hypothetical protein BSK64_11930 [Paenibacillus odorifer]